VFEYVGFIVKSNSREAGNEGRVRFPYALPYLPTGGTSRLPFPEIDIRLQSLEAK
jgi:hypothetical protein